MAEVPALPFESFSFSLAADKQPRAALRMVAAEAGMYELHVEKGAASRPSSQFTRLVPQQVAQRLRDGLQEAGVFGWDDSYGDAPDAKACRWSLSIVFKRDVFTLASKGGSAVPTGFDRMLEELYRLDFPRPAQAREGAAQAPGAASLPGLGDFGGAGVDYGQLAELMGGSGLPGLSAEQLAELLAEARSNPRALQDRMRQEFASLPRDEQERMLDALASAGAASRVWWERFLRG